ncbi:hypothetical protein KM043_007120 [Ampulex compressa]|nr:hypothetical protein KM043_007120 [Ampulex compressa]
MSNDFETAVLRTGISWILMPSILRMQGEKFRPSSWRVLAGLGAVPSLVMACISGLLPPSPRYLLYRQRNEQALAVFQEIYAINNGKHADTYPMNNLNGYVQPDEEDADEARNIIKATHMFIKKIINRIRESCRPPFKCNTALGILLSLLHFPGFIWFALWTTHVLEGPRRGEIRDMWRRNSTCNVDMKDITFAFLKNCQKTNSDRFEFLSLVSLSYILGEILLAIKVDTIGRKPLLVFSGLVGGAASFVFIFVAHWPSRILLSSLLLTAYAISCTSATIILLEMYPTRLRATAFSLMKTFLYLATSFTNLFLNISCISSIAVVSGFLIGAAIIGFLLPDLTNAPMKER